jgi:hypothetical protein
MALSLVCHLAVLRLVQVPCSNALKKEAHFGGLFNRWIMAIKVRMSQNVSGTAYQEVSYKIIQGILENPHDKEIDVLLTGCKRICSKSLIITQIITQLKWFKSQGYTVTFNDKRL